MTISLSRIVFCSSVAVTLSISGLGGAAIAQQRPELSELSDAELSEMAATVAAESARRERNRQLADACATLQRLGIASRPPECAGAGSADGGGAQPVPSPPQEQAQTPAPDQPEPVQQAQNQDTPPNQQPPVQQAQNDDTPPDPQRGMADDDDGKQRFGGIEFGIGMAFTSDLGDHARIREAQLVNGIVRVTRGDDIRARLILESHYFFTPPGRGLPFLGLVNPTVAERKAGQQPMWGFGPFVAIQPGTDNVIDAIGGGIMFGLRRGTEGTDSFNIGAGFLFDLDVQTLGDGILENQPLPAGETEIRFRRRAQSGFMILSSFSF